VSGTARARRTPLRQAAAAAARQPAHFFGGRGGRLPPPAGRPLNPRPREPAPVGGREVGAADEDDDEPQRDRARGEPDFVWPDRRLAAGGGGAGGRRKAGGWHFQARIRSVVWCPPPTECGRDRADLAESARAPRAGARARMPHPPRRPPPPPSARFNPPQRGVADVAVHAVHQRLRQAGGRRVDVLLGGGAGGGGRLGIRPPANGTLLSRRETKNQPTSLQPRLQLRQRRALKSPSARPAPARPHRRRRVKHRAALLRRPRRGRGRRRRLLLPALQLDQLQALEEVGVVVRAPGRGRGGRAAPGGAWQAAPSRACGAAAATGKAPAAQRRGFLLPPASSSPLLATPIRPLTAAHLPASARSSSRRSCTSVSAPGTRCGPTGAGAAPRFAPPPWPPLRFLSTSCAALGT
jgi:hypothetical protein